MKLTNYIRDAFIAAAMNDVPQGCDHTEEIRKLVIEDLLAQAPALIRQAWKDPACFPFVKSRQGVFGDVSVMYPIADDHWRAPEPRLTPEAAAKVNLLAEQMEADKKVRESLRYKLKGAAYACATVKQLRELLPEFDKYLPAEQEKTCRTLPAVANIVAEFTKAGWPKNQKAGGAK